MLLVSPERLANPGFGRRVLDGAGRPARAAGDRRGARGLRLGPRLPARLPPGLRRAPAAQPEHPGAGDHGDRQPAGHRRRRRTSSARATLVLRGPAGPCQPRAVGGRPALAAGALRLGGRPPAAARGLRHRLRADRRRRGAAGRRGPRRARRRRARRGLHRAARGRPSGTRSRTRCGTTGSRRWSPPRRWAWATTSPTSASSCTSGRRRPRSPTTSRSAVPAGRSTHAHAVLLPSDADAGVWEYFATATIPVPEQVRAVLDVLDRSPEEPLTRGRDRGAVGRTPRPGRADAQAAGRRRGGRPGRGRLARRPASRGATTPSTTTAWSPSAAARPTSCAPTSAASAA